MLTIFFSGTGNTEYVAKKFSQLIGGGCYSIEEKVDFKKLLTEADTIAVCYPIYGSCIPMIMRDFIIANKEYINGKKLVILSTQNIFSGDGARVLTDDLCDIDYSVVYAEHINMPNNISNLFFYPATKANKIDKYLIKADKKLNKILENIRSGKVKKRGFNLFSQGSGFVTQRYFFRKVQKVKAMDVRVSSSCIACGICVKVCPMKCLAMETGKVVQKSSCTFCYRCVNKCPAKAITVALHGKFGSQYKGIKKH